MTNSAIVVVESNAVTHDDTLVITEPFNVRAKFFAGDASYCLNGGALSGSYGPAAGGPLRDKGAMDANSLSQALLPSGELGGSLYGGLFHDATLAMLIVDVNSIACRK